MTTFTIKVDDGNGPIHFEFRLGAGTAKLTEAKVYKPHGREKETDSDAQQEGISDAISYIAEALKVLVAEKAGYVRPDVIQSAAETFAAAGTVGIGLDEPEYLYGAFQTIDHELMAQALLQYVGGLWDDNDESPLNRRGKEAAIEIAETLGPDHCQALYHLAVKATKLA